MERDAVAPCFVNLASPFARVGPGSERIDDRQPVDALSILQVFAVEGGAPRVQRGRDDEGIVVGEPVPRLYVQDAR